MLKPDFDLISSDHTGKIFLVNLLHSLQIGTLEAPAFKSYCNELPRIADKSRNEWWLQAIDSSFSAPLTPKETSTYASVKAGPLLTALEEATGDNESSDGANQKLYIDSILSNSSPFFWLTCGDALSTCESPKDHIDRLGLDYLDSDKNYVLVRVEFPQAHVSIKSPKRPHGLSKGSARFRARRSDESSHSTFENWGLTLDLKSWRSSLTLTTPHTGLPEVKANMGPAWKTKAKAFIVGTAKGEKSLKEPADHERYVSYLLDGNPFDHDKVYSELKSYL